MAYTPYFTEGALSAMQQGNQDGGGIDPLIGQGLIGGLNSIIQGILSGAGKKKRQKTAMRLWKEMAGERMGALNRNVRPEGQYQDFSQDPVVHNAIMAMLKNRMGAGFYSNMGLNQNQGSVPQAQNRYFPRQEGFRRNEGAV